jgi:outer membrane protein OmpA-like peptidoglycan-associated protein
MTHRALTLISCALYLGFASGCAAASSGGHRPPETLLQAREAYTHAEHSDAARFDPAGLHAARSSLDRAEALFDGGADSAQIETAAYVAIRRAQRTKLDGQTFRLENRVFDAQAQAKQLADDQASQPSAVDARADAAFLQLAPDITVMEQYRSTLIRLPCARLFRGSDAQLSAAGRENLDRVTRALKEQGDRRIVVVGYTDSGAAREKVEFSKLRAEAVAEYLAAHGVPRARLAARGLGSHNPVATNDTAEGRAENSRVEILVRRPDPDPRPIRPRTAIGPVPTSSSEEIPTSWSERGISDN